MRKKLFRPLAIGVFIVACSFLPFGWTSAAAATWHYSPGIEGGIVFGPDGAMYVTDSFNAFVYRVYTSGHASVFAGIGPPSPDGSPPFTKDHGWTEDTGYSGDGGPAVDAQLSFPLGLAFDAQGNLYIADHGNDVIRKVDTNGIITTVAGTGVRGFSGDGGPATKAKLDKPLGVVFDAAGNMYIADEENERIRKVDTSGIMTTYGGTGDLAWGSFIFSTILTE